MEIEPDFQLSSEDLATIIAGEVNRVLRSSAVQKGDKRSDKPQITKELILHCFGLAAFAFKKPKDPTP